MSIPLPEDQRKYSIDVVAREVCALHDPSTDLVQPPFFLIPDLWLPSTRLKFFTGVLLGALRTGFFISSRDKNSSELPLPFKVLGTFEQSELQECIFNRRGRVIRTPLWHVLALLPLDETARLLAQAKPAQLNPRYSETSVRTCVLNTAVIGYTKRRHW